MSSNGPRSALIAGAGGQLGRALLAAAPPGWRVVGCSSAELDITRRGQVAEILGRELPTVVINAAAYTAVDAAEQEPERAEAVNARGVAHLAEVATGIGARLIQVSTDFVFDGEQGRPYQPADEPRPVGVYGRTKLAGERLAAQLTGNTAVVLRTAWLYSPWGRNFVLAMLRLMRERDGVDVVSDQVGTPTWAGSLAEAIWAVADRRELRGIHHWTDAGVASWFDFATAVQEEALALGLLSRPVPIRPIRTEDYPAVAKRPPYSVLDKSSTWAALGKSAAHWRENLRLMLRELTVA